MKAANRWILAGAAAPLGSVGCWWLSLQSDPADPSTDGKIELLLNTAMLFSLLGAVCLAVGIYKVARRGAAANVGSKDQRAD
jgi:hypothetical protein